MFLCRIFRKNCAKTLADKWKNVSSVIKTFKWCVLYFQTLTVVIASMQVFLRREPNACDTKIFTWGMYDHIIKFNELPELWKIYTKNCCHIQTALLGKMHHQIFSLVVDERTGNNWWFYLKIFCLFQISQCWELRKEACIIFRVCGLDPHNDSQCWYFDDVNIYHLKWNFFFLDICNNVLTGLTINV